MTPAQAKRAAFLIQALEDISYDLDPPTEDRAAQEMWKYSLEPVGMGAADEVFKLEMADAGDDGTSHEIATIDRGLARVGLRLLVTVIKAELKELGVVL